MDRGNSLSPESNYQLQICSSPEHSRSIEDAFKCLNTKAAIQLPRGFTSEKLNKDEVQWKERNILSDIMNAISYTLLK
jgi:hypothetical protein